MNNRKRLIPALAAAALILSLIAVFPAFGAGMASFILPANINDDNDGALTVATTTPQAWGRQGGHVGLFYEDEDASVPTRRVLIPELDAKHIGTPNYDTQAGTVSYRADGMTSVTAHSADILVRSGSLKAGDYVMVGDHTVRRVVSVATPTALPASTSDLSEANSSKSEWYVWVPTDADAVAADIPDIVFERFDNDSGDTLHITVSTEPTPTPSADQFLQFHLYGDSAAPLPFNTTNSPIPSDSVTGDNKLTLRVTAPEEVTVVNVPTDTEYTVTIVANGYINNAIAQETYTVKLRMLHKKDTVTLDRPFAASSGDENLLDVYKITIDDAVLNNDDVDWANNYRFYAKAIQLIDDNSAADNVVPYGDSVTLKRHRADYVVADSNVSTTFGGVARIADDPTTTEVNESNYGDALHRLTGNQGSGRVRNDDAIIMTINEITDSDNEVTGYAVTDKHSVEDIDDEDVIFSGSVSDATFLHYLAAWFTEKSDVAVEVHSQAYRTPTTLVMRETYEGSGEFALKIKAVPFGTAAGESAKTDISKPIPELPVRTRDVVTLETEDSTATLPIETFPPSFTDLAPAHDTATQASRPEISAQVTDSDSGLDEKNIHILFMIEQTSGTTYKTLTPDRDGDVDEIAGGFSITGRLRGADAPANDAAISWWIMATDKTGNIGYSDRVSTKNNKDDACAAKRDADDNALTGETLIKALAADEACDAYVVRVDNTDPKLERAETGRHWDAGLPTGDSKDKTEYRVGKADKSSVLVAFSESLDAASVSASDFEVNGRTPVDAAVYNVKVRDDVFDLNPKYDKSKDANDSGVDSDGDKKFLADGNADIAGDSVQDVGDDRGYVFLTLASDMKPSATPKVALVDAVLDLAGNELDSATVNAALDRIAPTLTVSVNEGSRAVAKDNLNLKITSDENVGTPTVTFHEITSKTVGGKTMQSVDEKGAAATVSFVSTTEFAAVISARNSEDGLYTIRVEATDSAGGNKGVAGDVGANGDVNVDADTKAILFEKDGNIGDLDVNPDKTDVQDKFETDDQNAYVFIDFSAEANEYDDQKDADGKRVGDDLDTHHGVTIVSATLNGKDIKNALQRNDDGNVFLYKAPDGLAIGDHALEVVAQDAAGNKHPSPRKATIAIVERKPFIAEAEPRLEPHIHPRRAGELRRQRRHTG